MSESKRCCGLPAKVKANYKKKILTVFCPVCGRKTAEHETLEEALEEWNKDESDCTCVEKCAL